VSAHTRCDDCRAECSWACLLAVAALWNVAIKDGLALAADGARCGAVTPGVFNHPWICSLKVGHSESHTSGPTGYGEMFWPR
jgi:hypothetical protein